MTKGARNIINRQVTPSPLNPLRPREIAVAVYTELINSPFEFILSLFWTQQVTVAVYTHLKNLPLGLILNSKIAAGAYTDLKNPPLWLILT